MCRDVKGKLLNCPSVDCQIESLDTIQTEADKMNNQESKSYTCACGCMREVSYNEPECQCEEIEVNNPELNVLINISDQSHVSDGLLYLYDTATPKAALTISNGTSTAWNTSVSPKESDKILAENEFLKNELTRYIKQAMYWQAEYTKALEKGKKIGKIFQISSGTTDV